MVESRLHALGFDVPFSLVKIDFILPATDQFAGPQHNIRRNLERQRCRVCLPCFRFVNLAEQFAYFIRLRDRGKLAFRWAGQVFLVLL